LKDDLQISESLHLASFAGWSIDLLCKSTVEARCG
jgi:hypothetical protein